MHSTENKIKLSSVLIALFGTVVVAAFPALFMFFRNAGEAHFGDVVPAMLAFIGIGLALFCVALLVTRKPAKAGLISYLFLIVFLNYALIEGLIQKGLPELKCWHIAPLLLVLLLHAAWAIWKLMPDDIVEIISPVLGCVFAALIVVNGVTAIPSITTRVRAEQEARKLAETEVTAQADMPNIYFILFDEFGSIPFMQEHFNYDNTGLLEKLKDLGFNISQTGHNESIWTAAITTNLFNLSYVGDYYANTSEQLFRMRSENPVFEQLRAAGYTIVSPAGASSYGLSDALGKTSRASTINGDDLQTLLIHNTVIYPFITKSAVNEAQVLLDQFSYLKDTRNYPEHNQFTLAHIDCPHTPFLFHRDGTINDTISNSWQDLNMYLEQYIFASSQMYDIAESIVHNDPEAVVWLLSDHSARASDNVGFIFSEEDMTNFFSAVYYQGEPLDIEGLSGVNTFRVLLNKLLGTDYEMIPMP